MSDLNAILNNAVAAEDVPFVVKKKSLRGKSYV